MQDSHGETAQAETVAFLSAPESYPERPGRVGRLQTHISHVFLAGERAYKLKRAVTLPFLDFGTPERRYEACLNELRVNRRSAPQIYEDVVPVTRRADGGLEIGGRGAVVDWLVRMRRFDQDGLYDRMAEKGELGLDLMEPLAEAVFDLHSVAGRVLDRERPCAALEHIIRDNGEALSERPDIYEAAAVEQLIALSLERLRALAPLLRQRAMGGCVRHCHGDLHLRNIVAIDGKPVLFDAIEFDDGLATIDVLYDLGFLLMDLWRRGLKLHANRVLNAYVERDAGTANLPGLAMLPLYLSVRAAIRSKVKALEDGKDGEAAKDARGYFRLAQAFLAPPPPVLVAIGGLSGTGKSTVARAVAAGVGAAPGALILRSDVERKKLFGVAPTDRLGPEAYEQAVTRTVYGILHKKASFVLAAGHSVIVDAVHSRPDERDGLERLAAKRGAAFRGLWLEAPEKTLYARVDARNGDASDADSSVVRQQLGRGAGEISWTRIDAGRDIAATCAAVEAALRAG